MTVCALAQGVVSTPGNTWGMDYLEGKEYAVFNGVAPKVDRALLLALEEAELWMLAGAKGLSAVVTARLPV